MLCKISWNYIPFHHLIMQTSCTESKDLFQSFRKCSCVRWIKDIKTFKFFYNLKEINFRLCTFRVWVLWIFILKKCVSYTTSFIWESTSVFIGGCNTARATRSHCRKAANRRIKHRLTPNPQPQEIRTLDRIAYISAALLSSSSSRAAQKKGRVRLSPSRRGTNTIAFTANPVGANRRWNWFSRVTYFSAVPSDCERCPRERRPFCRISPTGHTDAPTQSARIRHKDAAGEKSGEEEARERRKEKEGYMRIKNWVRKEKERRTERVVCYYTSSFDLGRLRISICVRHTMCHCMKMFLNPVIYSAKWSFLRQIVRNFSYL